MTAMQEIQPRPTRRAALRQGLAVAGGLGAGALFCGQALALNKAAFETRSVADTVKALGGSGSLAESREVSVQGPEIAEVGTSVPVAIATTLAGVRQLALLVEKNPNTLTAVFNVSEAVEANFALRIKMAGSSNVYAVALLADGRALFAKREIKVTLGGCG